MMKLLRVVALIAVIFPFKSFGQSAESVEMADLLRQDGKIYTVVLALVVILTAMIILLVRVDWKIFRLENEIRKKK